MELQDLRDRFWWLGGHGEYILSLEGDTATVAVPRHAWNPIPAYEARTEAFFAALGIRIRWKDAFLDDLAKIIRDREELMRKQGVRMNTERFIERMKRREKLRFEDHEEKS